MVNAVNVVGKFYDMMLRERDWGDVDYIRIADLQVIKEVARSMSERVRYNPFQPDCIYPSKTLRVAPLLVVIQKMRETCPTSYSAGASSGTHQGPFSYKTSFNIWENSAAAHDAVNTHKTPRPCVCCKII